jgi:soluble lytic murein transglycosylase-like protein
MPKLTWCVIFLAFPAAAAPPESGPAPAATAQTAAPADPRVQPDAVRAMEASLARQRESVSSMSASLSTQREAVARQTRQAVPGAFFLFDPPARAAHSSAVAAPGECGPLPEAVLEPMIAETARRQELEPGLLRSVVRQESAFRPCAVSPKGAMGLMQLMPATALQLGVKNPFDPRENLDGGARFLKQLLDSYHDLPLALSAYNAGPGNVDPAQGVPKIPETTNYVQKILSFMPFGW